MSPPNWLTLIEERTSLDESSADWDVFQKYSGNAKLWVPMWLSAIGNTAGDSGRLRKAGKLFTHYGN